MAKVYILPYLRKGLATYINSNGKTEGKRAEISIALQMKATAVGGTEQDLTLPGKTIQLLGPADVKTLSSKAISRLSPEATGDVRLNCAYKPYIEFYEEDLPWRYTALSPESSQFHSWMALIAIKEDECKTTSSGGLKSAVLSLSAERYSEVFPTQEVLRASAHVQIDTDDDSLENIKGDQTAVEAKVNAVLNENPDCGISRIICPSKLERATQYIALLIPAYELGRLAGLSKDTSTADLATCAWEDTLELQQARPDGMTFPVYKKWKFTTAAADADFNTLAERLFHTSDAEYSEMKANLDVDISQSGLPSVSFNDDEKVIDVPASLVIDNDTTSLRNEKEEYREELKKELLLNSVLEENETGEIDMESDPWVVPPVYGARHLLTTKTDFENGTIEGKDYNIVDDVNLRLRNRIVAGMGSQIVKKNQEEFVNRAWKKVEVVNTINQLIREYYMMNEVNNKAKERSNRAEVLENKKKITKKNAGLLADAALSVLQSSGIYSNDVVPDTLFKVWQNMDTTEDMTVKNGLSKTDLEHLYSDDVWDTLCNTAGKLLSLQQNDNLLAKEDSFSKYSSLQDILKVGWNNDNTAYFRLQDDADFTFSEHVLYEVETFSNCLLEIFDDERNVFHLTQIYSDLQNISKRSLALEKTINKGNLEKVYPVSLNLELDGTSYKGFVMDDKEFAKINPEKKPLAIEYNTKDEKGYFTKKNYLIIISKSFLNSINEKNRTYSCNLAVSRYAFDQVYAQIDEVPFFKEVKYIKTLFENRQGCYFIAKSKKGRTYYEMNTPFTRACRTDSDIMVSFNGKHPWFCWDLNGDVTKNFYKLNGTTMFFYYAPYYKVVKEIVDCYDKLMKFIDDNDIVTVTGCKKDDFKIVTAEGLVEQAIKDAEDDEISEEAEKLKKAVEAQSEAISKAFGETKTTAQDETDAEDEYDLQYPDPDALGKERIAAICKKYGVTEVNQIEANLNSKYPVMSYPDFLDPTYFYLRELSVNYVLPGAGELLKNTISCFYSNPAFEEALLMGINTEMGHELLWREYPTDQRGSYFRKFWDQTTLPDKDHLNDYYDVKPVHLWDGKLGSNHMDGKDQMLVFAIKGELMQAFPDTAVYLREIKNGTFGETTIQASMTSWLTEDTYLVGFTGVKKEQLSSYFLVFEQMPMSLQFEKEQKGNINDWFKIVQPCIYALPAGK